MPFTIDDALALLNEAKAKIGGDKCLILSLTDSGLEDVDITTFVLVNEVDEGWGSRYVEVRACHPSVVDEATFFPTHQPGDFVQVNLDGRQFYAFVTVHQGGERYTVEEEGGVTHEVTGDNLQLVPDSPDED